MGPITTHFAIIITCNNEVACGSKNWMRAVDEKQLISLQCMA